MVNKDYTREQITNLINVIRECVRENLYTICLQGSRAENIQFIEEYNINETKFIEILFNLEEEDFCYGLKDVKDGMSECDFFIFCPKKELYNIEGKKEDVDVYIKINIVLDEKDNKRILVSIHKRNKPITYIFK